MSAAAPRSKGLALALLASAQFVVVLDASIVNVALPSIGRDLEFAQDCRQLRNLQESGCSESVVVGSAQVERRKIRI